MFQAVEESGLSEAIKIERGRYGAKSIIIAPD
jgi:hypothetical protein